ELRRARRDSQLRSKRPAWRSSQSDEEEHEGSGENPEEEVSNWLIECWQVITLAFVIYLINSTSFNFFFILFGRIDGACRGLVGLLTTLSHPEMQLEAARCFLEMSLSEEPSVTLGMLSAAPYLITFLGSQSSRLTESCLLVLGNLGTEGEKTLQTLLKQGLVPALCTCLQVKGTSDWKLPGLHSNNPTLWKCRFGAVAVGSESSKQNQDVWLLPVDDPHSVCATSPGILPWSKPRLFACPKCSKLILPLARCLGNVAGLDVTRQTTGTQACSVGPGVLAAGAVFCEHFSSRLPFLAKECLWLIRNITGLINGSPPYPHLGSHLIMPIISALPTIFLLECLTPFSLQQNAMPVLGLLCNIRVLLHAFSTCGHGATTFTQINKERPPQKQGGQTEPVGLYYLELGRRSSTRPLQVISTLVVPRWGDPRPPVPMAASVAAVEPRPCQAAG
uniref:Transmembrane and coiled-coil domains 6 n=1 Tax=Eptatretus burgeri TaxID=7764 RepID=A0A8C4NER6_EPTBU